MRHNTITPALLVLGLLGLFGCGKPSSTSDSATSSGGNPSASDSAAPSGANPTASARQSQRASEPAQASNPPIVMGAGTRITVTIDQTISSKNSNPGDHFDASLAAPVMVGNEQVIPSGARVSGTVTVSKSAGKFRGHAELGVTLDSIAIKGRDYSLRTTAFTESGKGRGQRTAVGVGGGAALGGIIGAIAGHGKGAAIGAVAGAGAGTAGAAYTGDRDITISAERKLTFKLTEPLEIRGK